MSRETIYLLNTWVPFVVLVGAVVLMSRKAWARQNRIVEILTEIRDRLPPPPR